jgi:hypothetical protein
MDQQQIFLAGYYSRDQEVENLRRLRTMDATDKELLEEAHELAYLFYPEGSDEEGNREYLLISRLSAALATRGHELEGYKKAYNVARDKLDAVHARLLSLKKTEISSTVLALVDDLRDIIEEH